MFPVPEHNSTTTTSTPHHTKQSSTPLQQTHTRPQYSHVKNYNQPLHATTGIPTSNYPMMITITNGITLISFPSQMEIPVESVKKQHTVCIERLPY